MPDPNIIIVYCATSTQPYFIYYCYNLYSVCLPRKYAIVPFATNFNIKMVFMNTEV